MQVSRPKARFVFRNPQQTIETTSIVKNSINITKQLYNDLHSSSNTCSLQLIDDGSGLIEKIINDNTDVTVLLNDIDAPATSSLFYGILSNDHSWRVSMTGEDVFQIKLEDPSTRYFDKPFVDYDDTCVRDTLYNVVQDINRRCLGNNGGVIFDSSVTTDIKNKILVNKISSTKTCKEVLDEICYEFGLVYYFKNVQLRIKKTPDLSSSPVTTIGTTSSEQFTPDHYLYEEGGSGIDLTRKARQYSQAKVKYSTISDSGEGVSGLCPIYAVTDKITVGPGQWWDGENHSEAIYQLTLDELFVSGKTYYTVSDSTYTQATIYPATDTDPTHTPKVGDVVPDNTYYEYAGQASRVNMSDSANGKEILYVYPDTITPTASDRTTSMVPYVEKIEDPATPSKWTIRQYKDTTNLEVLIDNTQGGTSAIYSNFSAVGRIIRKQGTSNIYRSLAGMTGNSETQFNYEAQWVHNKNDAIALCELLSKYYLYCDNTYTFYCKDDIELGSVVRVYENVYSGLDTNMFLIAKQYTLYKNQEGVYKYTAQGMTAFDLTQTTRVENYNQPDEQPTLVSSVNMYALSDQGTDPTLVTGWNWSIPTGVTGQYLWTRTTNTYSNGKVEESYTSSSFGDIDYKFNLTADASNFIINWRNDAVTAISVTLDRSGYTGAHTIKAWWTDSGSADEPDFETTETHLTIVYPYRNTHTGLNILAEIPDVVGDFEYLEPVDITNYDHYSGQFNIDTSLYFDSDGNLIPDNYDQIDFSPVENDIWRQCNGGPTEGDSFFNNYSDNGFEDCYIYVYNYQTGSETGIWVPINYSNLSNAEKSKICAQAQKDVLSTIKPGSVTKSDYGYFNTIVAGMITADFIGSDEIELHDGGFLYGGNVDISLPPGQRVISNDEFSGFCFDSHGNAEVSNIRVTGKSTIEGNSIMLGTMVNYDSNGNEVFKTVKDTDVQASMRGSKLDGTNDPSAYKWNEFTPWLKNAIESNATSGTYYTCTNSFLAAKWDGSNIDYKDIQGLKYWSSLPSPTSNTVNGSSGAGTAETKTMYTNPNSYWMKFSQLSIHPKTKQSIWGTTGYGEMKVTIYNSNGSIYQVLCDTGETSGTHGVGMIYKYDVLVPPYGWVDATGGTYSGFPWGSWDSDMYITFSYSESDTFATGVNFIDTDGYIYSLNSCFPTSQTFENSRQKLTCSSLSMSLDMQFTAASTWPVKKYYNFAYTVSPGTSETVTTSILTTADFRYDGGRFTVSSITYNNTSLKVIDTYGITYEFTTGAGNFYPEYLFDFTAQGQNLGAYAHTLMPTDDSSTNSIGGVGTYPSGNSQRWDYGYFDYLDSNTINSGWSVPIITANYTITDDIPVGVMRPYFINSASTVSLTMPGTSSQRYVVMANNVIVVSLVGAGKLPHYELVNGGASLSLTWTSSAEPYLLVYVIRIQ